MGDDLTIEILKQIRDGIGSMHTDLNARLDGLNERVDGLNVRVDGLNVRVDRVERGLLDLGKFMRTIALAQTKHERFHTHHVERLEGDVDDLKERVARLEDTRSG